jgi:hypothetical protein
VHSKDNQQWSTTFMKTLLSALSTAAAISLTTTAVHAQEVGIQQSVSFGVFAGGENVTGSYKSSFKPGIVAGTEAQFPLQNRRLALRADVAYHWIGETGTACFETGCVDQGRHSHMWSGSVDLIARLNDPATRWSPYVIAGGAFYLMGNADERLLSFQPSRVGLQGGVGFEVRPRNKTLFVELRYMSVPPGGVVPVTIGMRF